MSRDSEPDTNGKIDISNIFCAADDIIILNVCLIFLNRLRGRLPRNSSCSTDAVVPVLMLSTVQQPAASQDRPGVRFITPLLRRLLSKKGVVTGEW